MSNKNKTNLKAKKSKKEPKVPFLTIAKTLYSNQAVLDSRKRPWYAFLVIVLLSVFLVWIPGLSTGYRTNAAGGLAVANNYEVNKAIKHIIGEEDYFKSIAVKEQDGKLVLNRDGLSAYGAQSPEATWKSEYDLENTKSLFRGSYNDASGKDAGAYVKDFTDREETYYFDCIGVKNTGNRIKPSTSTNTSVSTTDETETDQTTFLEAYYFPKLSSSDTKYRQYLNNFISTIVLNRDKDAKLGNYPHSFRLVGQDFRNIGFFTLKTTKATTQRASSYSGNLSTGLAKIGAKNNDSLYNLFFKDANTTIDEAYSNGFIGLAHAAGWDSNIRTVWINIGILSGIVGGLILISALVLFLLSRRKLSLYRDTNFYQALKEGAARTLTPSLIARVLGFRSSQYRYRVLIAGVLRRLVFANNKICPPRNTASDNKPLYQARD